MIAYLLGNRADRTRTDGYSEENKGFSRAAPQDPVLYPQCGPSCLFAICLVEGLSAPRTLGSPQPRVLGAKHPPTRARKSAGQELEHHPKDGREPVSAEAAGQGSPGDWVKMGYLLHRGLAKGLSDPPSMAVLREAPSGAWSPPPTG